MNDLLEDKYYCNDDDVLNGAAVSVNKYGFIWFKNPNFLVDDDEREYIVRKPTPKERREIVINTVIECNGRTFAIPKLAERLGVSDRTIQSILRQLQKDGLIQIAPRHGKTGKQKANAYRYIGPPCEKYGSGLTLKLLYSPDEVGFRDWAWKECAFIRDKNWHSIYPLCQLKFETRTARKQYLLDNNLPLNVPEDIKYLVIKTSARLSAFGILNDFYVPNSFNNPSSNLSFLDLFYKFSGTPPTIVFGCTSCVTTAPATTTEFSHIVSPPKIVEFAPIQTLL